MNPPTNKEITMRRPAILTAFLCLVLAACAGQRDAVVMRVSVGLDAARASFLLEDETLQRTILHKAHDSGKTEAEAAAELAKFRAVRDKVLVAMEAARAAVFAASLDPSDLNVSTLLKVSGDALTLYNDLREVLK